MDAVEAIGLVNLSVTSNGKMDYDRRADHDIMVAFAKTLIAATNHLLQIPIEFFKCFSF
jgi:hypothetical protein